MIKNYFSIDNSANRWHKKIVICGHSVISWLNTKHVTHIHNNAMHYYIGKNNTGTLVEKCRFKPKKSFQFNISNKALLCELVKLQHPVYIPNPGNMGDMLIASATLHFFKQNHIHFNMFGGHSGRHIIYGGGGIWTPDYKNAWQKFLPLFQKADKIVILPSSFHNVPELIQILDERFTIFCRERKSYDYLVKANTRAKIILDHDMAFRIDKEYFKQTFFIPSTGHKLIHQIQSYQLGKIAYLNRCDIESTKHFYTDLDLSSLVYGDEYSSPNQIHFYANVMLSAIYQSDTIITDRLHVAIAATLLSKNVYIHDNTYGKLSGVYRNTLYTYKNIMFFNDIA